MPTCQHLSIQLACSTPLCSYGTFYRSQECTLKSQQLAADSLPTWYARVSPPWGRSEFFSAWWAAYQPG